jgi:hypothetical protein
MRILIILCLVLLAATINAQDASSTPKNSYIPQSEDRLIMALTSDNWAGLPSGITAKPFRSRGFTVLFMSESVNSASNFGLGYGIGFNSQNVHTDGIIVDTLNNGTSSTLVKIPDSLGYDLNKLSLNFLTAALEFRMRTNENTAGHRFKLSLGLMCGILLQSHTKYEDKNGKVKGYHVENLNTFQYGATARLGYGKFMFFGYYSFVDVFKKNRGTALTPYSIGLGVAI